jgi:hypothetical protein
MAKTKQVKNGVIWSDKTGCYHQIQETRCERCGHDKDIHNPAEGKNMIHHGCLHLNCKCMRFIEIGTAQKQKEAEEYWRNK